MARFKAIDRSRNTCRTLFFCTPRQIAFTRQKKEADRICEITRKQMQQHTPTPQLKNCVQNSAASSDKQPLFLT